jgi:hypothetical protein
VTGLQIFAIVAFAVSLANLARALYQNRDRPRSPLSPSSSGSLGTAPVQRPQPAPPVPSTPAAPTPRPALPGRPPVKAGESGPGTAPTAKVSGGPPRAALPGRPFQPPVAAKPAEPAPIEKTAEARPAAKSVTDDDADRDELFAGLKPTDGGDDAAAKVKRLQELGFHHSIEAKTPVVEPLANQPPKPRTQTAELDDILKRIDKVLTESQSSEAKPAGSAAAVQAKPEPVRSEPVVDPVPAKAADPSVEAKPADQPKPDPGQQKLF